jgi:hypothetical protein
MKNGRKARKQQDRTKTGINLRFSSRHAHLVSLVLSLLTGVVSPQFHHSYDDLFETTNGMQTRSIPKSQWQYKVGFVKELNKLTNIGGEQETGVIPFNGKVISPIVLRKNLIKLGFKPSEFDECVFYYGTTIFIVFTYDTILLIPDKKEIEIIFKKLESTFNIEDQGELSDYFGIKIIRSKDGTME